MAVSNLNQPLLEMLFQLDIMANLAILVTRVWDVINLTQLRIVKVIRTIIHIEICQISIMFSETVFPRFKI